MVQIRSASIIACLALVLTACGGGDGDQGAATGEPTGATALTGPTAATGGTAPTATPLAPGELEPGTYSFGGFGEPLTLTLGEGWQADIITELRPNETRLAEYFALFNVDHPKANIAFLMPTRMVDPSKDWDQEGNIVPVPDLITYFTTFPDLEAEPPTETTVAGRSASSVETLVIDVPKNGWPPCGGACVLWAPITAHNEDGPLTEEDNVLGAPLEEVDRHIIVEIGGNQLWIDIGAIDRKAFDAFVPLAEEVLSTVQIG